MSTKYPGGIISKTAPTPSGPYSTDTAPGVWTLEQQAYWQKLGQWPTAGNVNPNAFIENLFSTYLYTGTGAAQTITNGVNLSANGGMVWFKARSAPYTNRIFDTARGVGATISSNSTGAQFTDTTMLSAFNTTGFSLGLDSSGGVNDSGATFASWTFRKQAKFFDVVTWTGDGVAGRQISHSLGSAPGAILVKNTNDTRDWAVWHNTLADGTYLKLNTTDAVITNTSFQVFGNASGQTSTYFTVGQSGSGVNGLTNASSATYVAYLFADDAGGFGLSGTDNVVSCGSFTTDGSSNASVTLGYEPQWILCKSTSYVDNWFVVDNMRGWTNNGGFNYLLPNSSSAELTYTGGKYPTATGFEINTGNPSSTYIYVAIRRGPMATPTTGTSVFSVDTYNQTSAADPAFNLGGVADMGLRRINNFSSNWIMQNRLTGNGGLVTNTADAESTQNYGFWDNMVGWYQGGAITPPYSQSNWYGWNFKRAPGFMDVVCWTRSTTTATLNHNLGVIPELIIKKDRSRASTYWDVMPNISPYDYRYDIYLNDTQAISGPSSIYWNAAPTATTFDVNMGFDGSSNGDNFVAYLFASVAGVSKVGSYTGTGTTQQVNCGFVGGARFVLIKRTDSTGDWYVWDSTRGIVSGNDPYLLLNSTAVEVTGTDYVDTYSAGFEISSTAPSAINASGGTFIFLAIA